MNDKIATIMTMITFGVLLVSCGRDDITIHREAGRGELALWEREYDASGRLIGVVNPGGKPTTIKYDVDSQKQDRIRRIVKQTLGEPDIVYDLDEFGRRIAMTDATGKVRYEYDGFGRLIAVHRPQGPSIHYTYNTMDRVSTIRVGTSFTIRYVYDFLGRLSKIETPKGNIVYEYLSAQHTVRRTLPNGIRTHWTFQHGGHLVSITHVAPNDEVLVRYSYAYRPDDLIREIKEWTPRGEQVFTYTYDTVQRLVAVTSSQGHDIRYCYDKFGNRTEINRDGETLHSQYDWAGRLLMHNGQDVPQDAAGNIAALPTADAERTFKYGTDNLLQSINDGEVQYEYDGDGFLTARTVDRETTTFVPDPLANIWRPLAATDTQGNQTYYIWDGDVPLAAVAGDRATFYLHDHLNSVRSVVEGNDLRHRTFSPYGVPEQDATQEALQPGFTGLFYDPEAQLYLTRARSYDPALGRFLQIDPQHRVPYGSQKDLSMYAYCGGDPVNYTDLTGLQPCPCGPPPNEIPPVPQQTPQWVWGPENMLWQLTRKINLLDVTYAKQWYAQQAERSLASARGTGFSAGLQATAWDLIGGYIPGKPVNSGQRYAQMLWSFASLGSVGAAGGSQILSGLGAGRGFGSSLINASEGNYAQSALDIFGLGGTWLGLRAQSFPSKIFPQSNGQYVFGYAYPGAQKGAQALLKSSDEVAAVGAVLGTIGSAFDAWENPFLGGPSGGGPCVGCGGGDSPPGLGPQADTPLMPTNVGGIALRGAGRALESLGALIGIALDENGRLILISEEQGEISLPPLHLDDVVTIFRSVYNLGDAPYVSIDPNPEDPEGPVMLVRHGEGSEDTYVGWVLFEADRIMKAYSLGTDNVTRQLVTSRVPDYRSLLDLGFTDTAGRRSWERFWIVPAAVNRRHSIDGNLSIFDVPLRVKTERMEMRNGRLETMPNVRPSRAADTFAKWFTAHYDEIASEALLPPPAGSDIDTQVAVFTELRRLALITAIAESLRDQGVSLPLWMRSYEVQPIAIGLTTPAVTVSRTQGTRTQSIYGGAGLSPDGDTVFTASHAHEADSLEKEVLRAMAGQPSFEPVAFKQNGKRYRAVALPGNDTQDVAAVQLEEADLVVPVADAYSIALVRRYNSFFDPSGVFGHSWTLDLPSLRRQRVPKRRTGDTTEYDVVFEVSTPLNTYSERFASVYVGDDRRIGYQTDMVKLPSGERWHFDDAGLLVGIVEGPMAVIYKRDKAGRIGRIEGWYGQSRQAYIDVAYDAQGRVVSAQSSDGQEVAYEYDSNGMLVSVSASEDSLKYEYSEGLVTAVQVNGEDVRRFEYGQQRQLVRQKTGDQSWVSYAFRTAENGVEVQAEAEDGSATRAMISYDSAFRPVEQTLEDGTHVRWHYSEEGMEAVVTLPQGLQYIVRESPDGRQRAVQLPEGGVYQADYDENGRLISFRQDQQLVLRQSWLADGRLESIAYETVEVHPEYNMDGLVKRVLITAPDEGPMHSQWLALVYDDLGRLQTITDDAGADMRLAYDQEGRLTLWESKNPGAVTITYDPGETTLQTTWGYTQYTTYDVVTGKPRVIEVHQEDQFARLTFKEGRLRQVRQFDGGKYKVSYYDNGSHTGLVKSMQTPNGVVLDYGYTDSNRLAWVESMDGIGLYYTSYTSSGGSSGGSGGCSCGCSAGPN